MDSAGADKQNQRETADHSAGPGGAGDGSAGGAEQHLNIKVKSQVTSPSRLCLNFKLIFSDSNIFGSLQLFLLEIRLISV